MATQLNVNIVTNGGGASGGTITAATITVPIPAALQTLDGGQSAATQTGNSSVDQLARAIFRCGVFTPDGKTWYNADTIQSITAT